MAEDEASGAGAGDSVTEVGSQSWLSRLLGSLIGVLIGFLLVPGAGIGLWWNEGRAVQTARSLAEGEGAVVEVGANPVESANQGRLVHVTGPTSVAGPLRDGEFGVAVEALRLLRKVEMYQWKETKEEETRNRIGGGQDTVTTYKYAKGWYDEAIESQRFREPRNHANPAMPYRSSESVQPSARLGGFTIPQVLLGSLDDDRRLALDEATVDRMGRTLRRPARFVDGVVFAGGDPLTPQVGDLRIGFTYAPVQTVSVIAAQSGSELAPYQTRAGDRLHMIVAGNVPAAAMFKAAEDANTALTWILRGVGALVMFIGFALVLRPLSVLASLLPLLGDIVGAGTGLVSLTLTALVAPIVIAVAWLAYRPIVGIAILSVGLIVAFAFGRLSHRRAAGGAVPAATAAPIPVSR